MVSESDLDYLDEYDPSRGVDFRSHLVAGSLAGLAEHCVMFPLDTIKTHAQCVGACGGKPDVLCVRAAKSLLREHGLGRLWRGVGAVTIACVPAHACYFGIFEAARTWDGPTDVVVNGVAGSLAAVGHDVVMTPADVVKQRLQLGHHANFAECATALVRTSGASALFRSLPTTLAMNVPYGSVSVAANEWFKKRWRTDRGLPVSTLLLSGGLAGAIASFVTTPLDVVKTRLQTQGLFANLPSFNLRQKVRSKTLQRQHRHHERLVAQHFSTRVPAPPKYHGFLDAATDIWRHEGPRGFFRGATVRALAQAPSVAIVWTTYELLVALSSSHLREAAPSA